MSRVLLAGQREAFRSVEGSTKSTGPTSALTSPVHMYSASLLLTEGVPIGKVKTDDQRI
jgi:hypothetical protein